MTPPRTSNVQILEAFKPLLDFPSPYTYYVYSSGRGCGKSYGIGQALIIRAAMRKIRILCIREVQKSLNESVKALLESLIVDMGLHDLFTIRHDSIECVNGSKFLFMGMREANAVNVKSIADIDITWIEEAEAFTKRSWELLVPSVTRTSNPFIVISFNPRFEHDVIYQTFFVKKPPPKSFIRKLKPENNPFFKNSNLEVQRQHDYETMPPSEYKHKWLGELIKISENSLFDASAIENSRTVSVPDLNEFSRIVVACDPATTHREFSNEYGIVVCGMHRNGKYWMLDNCSATHTPSSFAEKVNRLVTQYDAHAVVVEVNQGGDFIKSTLLQQNPFLNIIEVRASKDKVHRASPVASMMALNKILILDLESTNAVHLITQMSNTTTQGYIGPKGSSPDALDAFVWGIYELAGLSDKDTENTLFDISLLDKQNGFDFRPDSPSLFVCADAQHFVAIEFLIAENTSLDRRLVCLHCFADDIKNLGALCDKNSSSYKYDAIWVCEREAFYDLSGNIVFYDDGYKDKNLDNLALQTLQTLKQGKVIDESSLDAQYKDVYGRLIPIMLGRYKLEQKQECLVTKTFCMLVRELI